MKREKEVVAFVSGATRPHRQDTHTHTHIYKHIGLTTALCTELLHTTLWR